MTRSEVLETPPTGRREHRKHVTRRELLVAGRELFSEKGLYESRIEDLANRAGIAKGTLYGYFSDKEELIQAVVRTGFDEMLEHVRVAARGARTRRDLIARIVRGHLEFFARNPDLMRVFHQVRGMLKFNRPEWRPLRTTLADYLQGLVDVLGVSGAAGRPDAMRRVEVVRMLFGAISGVTSVRAALVPDSPRPLAPRAVTRALVAMATAFEAEIGARVRRPAPVARSAARARGPRRGPRARVTARAGARSAGGPAR